MRIIGGFVAYASDDSADTVNYKSSKPKHAVTKPLQDIFDALGINMAAMLKDVITEHAKATAASSSTVVPSARPNIREGYRPFLEELTEAEARELEAIKQSNGHPGQFGYEWKIEEHGALPRLAFTSLVCTL